MLIRIAAGLAGLLLFTGAAIGQTIWGAKASQVQFGIDLQQIAEQTLKSVANEALKNAVTPPKSSVTPGAPTPGASNSPFPYVKPPAKQAPNVTKAPKPAKKTTAVAAASSAGGSFPFETQTMTTSPDIEPVIVPVYQGLPISGYNRVLATADARTLQEDLGRWFLLMDLAATPSMLDSPETALGVATLFLPIEKWGNYFNCASPGLKVSCAQVLSRSQKNHRRPMDGWKGGNEFEKARSHKAFVQDYRDLLTAQAASLPQDIYLVAQANFRQYSAEQGGFPLTWQNGLLGAGTAQEDGNVRGVPLAGPYTAPLFMNLPKLLPCQPDQCEDVVTMAPQRMVYALLKLRVTHVDSGSQVGLMMESRASGNGKSKAELTSGLRLFADKELSQLVHAFEAPAQLVASKTQDFSAGPVILNADTLLLLMLKYSSAGMQTPSMEGMYQLRNRSEASFYALASNGQWPEYDPWGPYFPSAQIHTAAPAKTDITEFSLWSKRRAASFPRALLMRFWFTSSLTDSDVGLITSKLDSGGQGISGVTDLYLSDKSSSLSQDPASVLDRNGVAAFSNIIGVPLASGTSVSSAAIVFPEPVQTYRMKGPIKPGDARQIDPVFSELDLDIDSVRFWPEDAPKIMLVYVKPQKARIKKGDLVLAETPLQAAGAVVESNGGFDVLGVSLGMPVPDAEKLLREYLQPDGVEDHVAQDPSLGYTQSRLYSSTEKNERVIVFASADGTVAGIERVMSVKPEHRGLVERGLIEKYGQPQKKSSSGAYEWWPKKLADYCYTKQSQRHNSQSIEGPFKGRTSVGNQALSIFEPHGTRVSAEALSRCGPILSATVSPALRLYLYDHRAYMQTAGAALEAAKPTEPKLKF